MVDTHRISPQFIDGPKGRLYTVLFGPNNNETTECIVVIPALAEEMNRCRYMVNMLAQASAKHNLSVLHADFYGTGDSDGEHSDCSIESWIEDISTAIEHCRSLGFQKISLLAIRHGALLLPSVVQRHPDIARILLWQPVIDGKQAVTQFLRIRIAAAMARNEQAESTKDLIEQLERGEALEVSGYDVAPELLLNMQSLNISKSPVSEIPCNWYSVIPSADRKVPRPELAAIDAWNEQNPSVSHHVVIGAAFWQAHERTLAPELIDVTTEQLANK